MEVLITKRERRNELTCVRIDCSQTRANLGPGLPYHDLAHYVAERHFNLRSGFFGNIASGYSLQALSDKEIIKTLGAESWVAEALAGALGSLATGACSFEQFPDLVTQGLEARGIRAPEGLSAAAAEKLLAEFKELVARYDALKNGETLKLHFA
jgi:hypothetical protein